MFKALLMVSALLLLAGLTTPASAHTPRAAGAVDGSAEAARLAAIVDPLVESHLRASGAPGAAFVFFRDGRIVYRRGYGHSDVASRRIADPAATLWPAASITKVITALAALQLVDDGRLDLDADLNIYLKRLRVPSQGQPPLTLRHLLTHSSGLDELPGRRFDGRKRPDMAAFLQDRIVRYRAPGLLTSYGSYGMLLAGILVEDVAGRPFPTHVRDKVLRPAGMRRARMMIVRGDELGVATPYEVGEGRAREVPFEYYVSSPTSSLVASADDMARLGMALVAPPRRRPLLSPDLLRAMHAQQASIHPQLPGWGFGLQLDKVNGRRISEHGGDIAGFASLLVMLPDEQSGFFIVNHGEGSDLRFRVKQAVLDALHPDTGPRAAPLARAADAERLEEYAGRYISTLSCRSCGADRQEVFELEVKAEGTLAFWAQTWVPAGEDLFVRADGKRLLGFARDAGGKIISVSGGSWRVADRLPPMP